MNFVHYSPFLIYQNTRFQGIYADHCRQALINLPTKSKAYVEIKFAV